MNTTFLRFAQKKFYAIQKKIIFKTSHLTNGGKISLFGIGLSFISLFLPWAESIGSIISSGNANIEKLSSFSLLLGGSGYFILISLMLMIFFIFSIQKKEKIKYLSSYHISDFAAILLGSIFIIIFCLHTFLLIVGLKTFSGNIHHSQGIILCISGSIISIFGSIIIASEYRKNIKGSYIHNTDKNLQESISVEQKDNMKLPF